MQAAVSEDVAFAGGSLFSGAILALSLPARFPPVGSVLPHYDMAGFKHPRRTPPPLHLHSPPRFVSRAFLACNPFAKMYTLLPRPVFCSDHAEQARHYTPTTTCHIMRTAGALLFFLPFTSAFVGPTASLPRAHRASGSAFASGAQAPSQQQQQPQRRQSTSSLSMIDQNVVYGGLVAFAGLAAGAGMVALTEKAGVRSEERGALSYEVSLVSKLPSLSRVCWRGFWR